MKIRKTVALGLALLLALALFAGCDKGRGAIATPVPSAQTQAPSAQTQEPVEDEGPIHLPRGKYAVDSEGWPVDRYVYDKPICDSDVTFTRWTTCYTPQYLPEGGFNAIETWQQVAAFTGVHIEFNVVDSGNRRENFSVLIASDDLCDFTDQGMFFYTGTVEQALDGTVVKPMVWYRVSQAAMISSLRAWVRSGEPFGISVTSLNAILH